MAATTSQSRGARGKVESEDGEENYGQAETKMKNLQAATMETVRLLLLKQRKIEIRKRRRKSVPRIRVSLYISGNMDISQRDVLVT